MPNRGCIKMLHCKHRHSVNKTLKKITDEKYRPMLKQIFCSKYGFFTLPDTDLDPDPATDMHPNNGYNNDWGSGSELESEPESVQW